MRFKRKSMICAAALAGIGLVTASTAHAEACRHFGRWTLTDDGYVCSGDYDSPQCLWYDDCRVNVE